MINANPRLTRWWSLYNHITFPLNIDPAASIGMWILCPEDLPMLKPFEGGTIVTRMSQQGNPT